MPERLKRLDMVYQHAPIYYVTACTANRRHILANQAIHDAFKGFAQAGENCGAWIGRYVIMPDHLHLFVSIDGERLSLSAWMKSLKGALSLRLRENGTVSPYWQKGFFDRLLRSGESYARKSNYVQDNPIRAGLVTRQKEWPYLGHVFDLEFRSSRF